MAPFYGWVQLLQGYNQFREAVYFLPFSPQKLPQKDERLSRPWSHPVVLNRGPINWESSTLSTRSLIHNCSCYFAEFIKQLIERKEHFHCVLSWQNLQHKRNHCSSVTGSSLQPFPNERLNSFLSCSFIILYFISLTIAERSCLFSLGSFALFKL